MSLSCFLVSSTGANSFDLSTVDIDFEMKILFILNIIRMVKPRIVLLIFVSGKVVLTGAKVSIFLRIILLCLVHIVDFRCEQKSMKPLRISTRF